MNHLEIEYKTLLTPAEYNKLKPEFAKVEPTSQTNYYFDTEKFELKANRLSLRIRTLPTRAELTLKIPQEVGNMEYNQDLTLEEAKKAIDTATIPEGDILNRISSSPVDLKQVKVLGSLTTLRQEIRNAIGLMALDKNDYSGITDYELEVEVEDENQGKQDFDAYLKVKGIKFKYAKSKVARFSATLNKNIKK